MKLGRHTMSAQHVLTLRSKGQTHVVFNCDGVCMSIGLLWFLVYFILSARNRWRKQIRDN